MENLDLACAKLGSALATISKVHEKLVIDALSVLEEQGLYAFFLYLKAKAREGGPEGAISQKCHEFLRIHPQEGALLRGNERDALAHVRASLADDLDGLLLARDLLRQALIYARYHSKIRGG